MVLPSEADELSVESSFARRLPSLHLWKTRPWLNLTPSPVSIRL